jgi:hypothetical protein
MTQATAPQHQNGTHQPSVSSPFADADAGSGGAAAAAAAAKHMRGGSAGSSRALLSTSSRSLLSMSYGDLSRYALLLWLLPSQEDGRSDAPSTALNCIAVLTGGRGMLGA